MTSRLTDTLRHGAALHDAGRFEEALRHYDHAMARFPASGELRNNRATTLLEMGRHAAAAEEYQRALQLIPECHDARVALASCLLALGDHGRALAECDYVLARQPDHAEAHWNRALILLATERWPEAWPEYEWRWRKRRFTSPRRDLPQPLWQGEDLRGTTILIHAEQGYGDTIQFCRYLPALAAAGARVIFECHPPLTALMTTLDAGITVVSFGAPLPAFDCHLPLLSLPLAFGTTPDTIPALPPYLRAPEERLPFWRSVVPRHGMKNIGLCWAGKSYPDPARSIPVQLLEPLLAVPGAKFVSLQVGGETALPPGVLDLSSQLLDFADTAALISLLDLVVTIDTSVAHLAGALGRPTLLLLPHAPDWRWFPGRADSPWYPAMRLFRQPVPGAWPDVIRAVRETLMASEPGR